MEWILMERKLNLVKDQEVIIRYINDRMRYEKDKSIENIDNWTCIGKVVKIGRKYIEVNMGRYSNEKFDIERDYEQKVNAGSPDYKIYLSKEEIIDEIKADEIYKSIRNEFDGWKNVNKFTLNQLQRIKNIIDERIEE
jgi:hypothetical protein